MTKPTVITIGAGASSRGATKAVRNAAGPVESRAARIRRVGHGKYARAQTLSQRIAAGTDYVRMAVAEAQRSGIDARRAVEQANATLMATGDAIIAVIAGPGGAP